MLRYNFTASNELGKRLRRVDAKHWILKTENRLFESIEAPLTEGQEDHGQRPRDLISRARGLI